MKHLKKFEGWDPSATLLSGILLNKEDLTDESTIAQFIEYEGLNPMIMDIWKYAKNEFNKFPHKLTKRGMVYMGKNDTNIELEFGKKEITLWHIKFDHSEIGKTHLLKSGKFSYSLFKNMFELKY